jgi:hypothetical protein
MLSSVQESITLSNGELMLETLNATASESLREKSIPCELLKGVLWFAQAACLFDSQI